MPIRCALKNFATLPFILLVCFEHVRSLPNRPLPYLDSRRIPPVRNLALDGVLPAPCSECTSFHPAFPRTRAPLSPCLSRVRAPLCDARGLPRVHKRSHSHVYRVGRGMELSRWRDRYRHGALVGLKDTSGDFSPMARRARSSGSTGSYLRLAGKIRRRSRVRSSDGYAVGHHLRCDQRPLHGPHSSSAALLRIWLSAADLCASHYPQTVAASRSGNLMRHHSRILCHLLLLVLPPR